MTDSIKLADFEKLIAQAYDLDAEVTRIKKEVLEPAVNKLADVEGRILETLERHDMTSYRSSRGLVTRTVRYSVQTPKSPEEKAAFFNWLRESKGEDVFWAYATVNSQSLNSLYKAEMDIAKQEANFDFKIPGLSEPKGQPILSRRAK